MPTPRAAADEGIELPVVKPPEAKRGFVLLPSRRVVDRPFGWAVRLRRPAKDDEWRGGLAAGNPTWLMERNRWMDGVEGATG